MFNKGYKALTIVMLLMVWNVVLMYSHRGPMPNENDSAWDGNWFEGQTRIFQENMETWRHHGDLPNTAVVWTSTRRFEIIWIPHWPSPAFWVADPGSFGAKAHGFAAVCVLVMGSTDGFPDRLRKFTDSLFAELRLVVAGSSQFHGVQFQLGIDPNTRIFKHIQNSQNKIFGRIFFEHSQT